ncbi:KAP family P-loop NTPase fold protein [Chryseobacterium luteum]|uniref:KAP family P-loop NTPase fold protein n=1 Tax=Chryseobacterium luteum TaxID=421531 RepID=UPI00068D326F|nr:P-loop NTPase fold protein [Chryseobacterium luteum]
MEIRNYDVEIDSQKPFKNCVLSREKYAEILSNFIDKYNNNLVLAINNPWGTGKTTFIKMWQKSMQLKGYKTAFFNAWENDFNNDSLTAIIGELSLLKSEQKIELKKVVKIASKLSSELIPLLIKGFAEQKFGKDFIEYVDAAVKGGGKVLEQYVEDYTEKKQSLIEFKIELEKAISLVSPDKPVIFFIDELDRCRPNYSVEILEKIKHFFNVKNIIFVLAIDRVQLCHSICGVYNSEKINSDEYLKRFIDIEYTIPEPKSDLYISYLSQKFDINNFFVSNRSEELSDFQRFSKVIFGKSSLRTIEKMMGVLAISLISNQSRFIHFPLLLILIYLKIERKDYYYNFYDKNYTFNQVPDILDDLYKIFPKPLFSAIEAQFVIAYANYQGSDVLDKMVIDMGNVKYTSKNYSSDVINTLQSYSREIRNDTISLNLMDYFNRINITEEFEIF